MYKYDAYGRIKEITGKTAYIDTIGKLQPIKYKGYINDEETGYYYLQLRYYSPFLKRFISLDDTGILEATKGEILGANLYAYCNNNPTMMIDETGYIASNVIGAIIGGVIGAVGGYFLTRWLADKIGLRGWKRNVFIWGLSALIGAAAATIGYFIGPYVAKAWSWLSARLAGLIKGTFRSIGKITAQKMSHINVSKHLWNKVLGKVTNTGIQSLIYQAIRKGSWNILSNGTVQILWKYKGRIIVVTGKVIDKVFKIGDAWVRR